MKKITSTLIALGVAGFIFPAAAQTAADNNNPPPAQVAPAADGTTPVVPPPDAAPGNTPDQAAPPPDVGGDQTQMPADQSVQPAAPEETGPAGPAVILPSQPLGLDKTVNSDFAAPTEEGTNANDLNLNFRNAPIDMVLNYLSDAAGFIIVLDTHVNGTLSVIGKHLTKDEAVDLLNSVLNKNGYAAIRNDRTLTIVDKHDAMTENIPVKVNNNPEQIPNNDEIVTQIIPIRFVEARQLVSDLSSFVSAQATVVANEAGNSIVITDTQSNIRHLVEIIKAIDDSAEAETEIRVFRLKYASPTDVASELSSVFPSGGSSSGGTQSPIRFGGGGGGGNPFARFFGGGGGGGGGAAGGGSSDSDRIKKETQVTAVADSRIQAVIVTAPKDLMQEIAGMMEEIDVPSDRDQNVYVFKMNNGDPQQALTVLQSMFQSTSSRSSSSSSSSSSALQLRQQNNATTSSTTSGSSSGIGGGGGGIGGGGGGGGGRSF